MHIFYKKLIIYILRVINQFKLLLKNIFRRNSIFLWISPLPFFVTLSFNPLSPGWMVWLSLNPIPGRKWGNENLHHPLYFVWHCKGACMYTLETFWNLTYTYMTTFWQNVVVVGVCVQILRPYYVFEITSLLLVQNQNLFKIGWMIFPILNQNFPIGISWCIFKSSIS